MQPVTERPDVWFLLAFANFLVTHENHRRHALVARIDSVIKQVVMCLVTHKLCRLHPIAAIAGADAIRRQTEADWPSAQFYAAGRVVLLSATMLCASALHDIAAPTRDPVVIPATNVASTRQQLVTGYWKVNIYPVDHGNSTAACPRASNASKLRGLPLHGSFHPPNR